MVSHNRNSTEYRGTSWDTKPTNATNGARFVEMDKQRVFIFDKDNNRWIDPITGEVEEIKTPIAYSYNGTILPPLPEWDKETYPYAAIFFMYSRTDNLPVRILFFLGQPGTVGVANMWLSGGCSVLCYEILGDESEWRFVNESYVESGKNICTVASNMSTLPSSSGAWANHDIMYSDGKTYLSASEPIPVYK